MDFYRQLKIFNPEKFEDIGVTLIGAGAIGSYTALALLKMGVKRIHVYDKDGVDEHNLPNQFYRLDDVGKFKVDALKEMLDEYSFARVITTTDFFMPGKVLQECMVVATDSMASRRMAWEEFLKNKLCRYYIEARMGAEVGMVYSIAKRDGQVRLCDKKFYGATLYTDAEAAEEPCTARAIIYTVMFPAGFICRAYKGLVMGEKFPREIIFNVAQLHESSFMVRK